DETTEHLRVGAVCRLRTLLGLRSRADEFFPRALLREDEGGRFGRSGLRVLRHLVLLLGVCQARPAGGISSSKCASSSSIRTSWRIDAATDFGAAWLMSAICIRRRSVSPSTGIVIRVMWSSAS